MDEFTFKKYDDKYSNLTLNIKKYDNNLIIKDGFKNKKLTINFLGSNSSVELGENCNLQGVITVSDNATVKIGNNFSSTGGVTILCRDECIVTIGDGCMFATSILIRTSDEHSIVDLATNNVLNPNCDVEIGKKVWICDNTLILKGSKIGDECVIGARSVIAGKIDNNSLAVGVPAKVIRNNITWDKRRPKKRN